MKTKTVALPRPALGFWEGVTLLLVGILLSFAQRADGAITVTGTSLAEIPSFSDSDVVGRFYGHPAPSPANEVYLYGATTVSAEYTWTFGGNVFQPTNNMTSATIGFTGGQMSLGLNDGNGSVLSLGPVDQIGTQDITTLYIWMTSSASVGNSAAMNGITILMSSGSTGIGSIDVYGGPSNGGKTFAGIRVDLNGESLEALAWDQLFHRDALADGANGSDLTVNVMAVNSVPEPTTGMLGLLAGIMLISRRRR